MKASQPLKLIALASLLSLSTGSLALAREPSPRRVSNVQANVNGNNYVMLEGTYDRQGSDNNTIVRSDDSSYQCDVQGSSFDVPYIDRSWVNAEASVSVVLAAFLSGRNVAVAYNDDCRITSVRLLP